MIESITAFDRTRDDTSNIVTLEHVNLQQPDQQLATLFYVKGLQLTRDPFMMIELDNMWVNIGRNQMHLPTHASRAQHLRGRIGLIVPDLAALEASLTRVRESLKHTRFAFERHANHLRVVCPWGNQFQCHSPHPAFWGAVELGMPYVEFDVPAGTAKAIARFYDEIMGAPSILEPNFQGLQTASVRVGADQRLRFVETRETVSEYDGHHIQIYLADFSGPYQRLKAKGLISREPDAHEWRFIDIIDLDSGKCLYQLEHEVRSMRHPLFGRPLVNRNPAQNNRNYQRGMDVFRGSYL